MSVEVKDAPGTAKLLRETVHDMRQPIATMLALAAAALTEAELLAAAHARLEQIVGQPEWLVRIIRGCLAWQERERPDQAGEPDDGYADVVPAVTEVVAAEHVIWPGDVTLTSPAGPVWCMLHPLLRRAVSNVLVQFHARGWAARRGGRRHPAPQRRSASVPREPRFLCFRASPTPPSGRRPHGSV